MISRIASYSWPWDYLFPSLPRWCLVFAALCGHGLLSPVVWPLSWIFVSWCFLSLIYCLVSLVHHCLWYRGGLWSSLISCLLHCLWHASCLSLVSSLLSLVYCLVSLVSYLVCWCVCEKEKEILAFIPYVYLRLPLPSHNYQLCTNGWKGGVWPTCCGVEMHVRVMHMEWA